MTNQRRGPRPRTDPDAAFRDRLQQAFRWRGVHQQQVLLVDDWIASGGQAVAARSVVEQAGGTWCGVAVVVDALRDARLRRDLGVRGLLSLRDL